MCACVFLLLDRGLPILDYPRVCFLFRSLPALGLLSRLQHGDHLDDELGDNRDHEHHGEHGWANAILVRARFFPSDHGRSASVWFDVEVVH